MNRGLVNGYPDGTFKPERLITRQEWVVLLNRLLAPELEIQTVSFMDANQISNWALKSIQASVALNWINGYPDGTFKPNKTLTRAEAAVIIAKALRLDISLEAVSTKYTDDDKIPSWARSYVQAATEQGLFKGMVDGRFAPNKALTRAEAVTLLEITGGLLQ